MSAVTSKFEKQVHASVYLRHSGDVDPEHWDDPARGSLSFRTLFSGDATPTDTLTSGLGELPPGGRLALHRHQPAETYYVVEGEGVITLDGTEHTVRPGSAVYIPAGAEHGVHNTGSTPLRVFYTLAAHSMSDVEYRFTETEQQYAI